MLNLKALALGLAVIAAPTAVFAQANIGSVQISAEGLPYVVAYCEDLNDLDPRERYDHEPSFSQRVGSGIALHTVDLGDCRAAGLI